MHGTWSKEGTLQKKNSQHNSSSGVISAACLIDLLRRPTVNSYSWGKEKEGARRKKGE